MSYGVHDPFGSSLNQSIMDPIITNKDKDDILEHATTDLPTTITYTVPEYMSYSPSTSASGSYFSQRHYFDILGFKPSERGIRGMRDCLATDMNIFVRSTHHIFLNKASTKDLLKVAVLEFLAQYGPKYWGVDKRDHLCEPDILRGFLYPRDAQREDSRLIENFEQYFRFKRRSLKTSLRQMEAAASGNPKKSNKRSIAHRESKDSEEDEVVPFEPSESSKRRWPLPPSLDMSIPSLLNGGGLSKQIWRPQPQIASIHRPAYETPSLLNSGGFSNQTREPTPSQPQIASIHRPAYKTPLLLNSGGLSKQTWKTVPSQPQIASIHRPTYETRSLLDSGGFSNQTRELTPLQLQTTSIRRPLYKTPSLLDSGGFSNQTWEPTPSELQVASIHRPAYMIPSANLEKKTKPADLSPSSHRGALPREVEAFGFIQTPGLHGPTTPLTPVLNPSRHDGEIINLSDDSDDCEEQRGKKSTTTSTSTSTMNDKASIAGTAHSIVEVKSEPLTDSMMMNTILLVTVHGSPLGPVPVPFTECRDFHVLFAKLIEERGVPDDDARKIDSITTTFAWTGGEFGGKLGGIRRHKPRDWDYFRDTLRKAHEMDFDRFKGKCEVAMKLHINAL